MEVSLKLLNQYVKVDDYDAKEIARLLTSIGHEVEGMRPFAYGDQLVIGYITSCQPLSSRDWTWKSSSNCLWCT